nr:hypothetical protein [Tanacetum cinerariifolium]GEX39733.1 hypothetical protein [Tanacetum cinerariifolium]
MLAVRQPEEERLVDEQVQVDDAVEENVAEDGAEFPTQIQQVLNVCSALTKRVENLENDNAAQKLGRMIDDMDKDEGIELVKDAEVAESEGWHATEQAKNQAEIYHIDLDHSSKVLKVVTAAALQVSAASATIPAASATIPAASATIPAAAPTVVAAYTRRRKGDKGKGIMVETPKLMKKKDQIELDAEYARKLHEEINRDEFNKDIDWDAAMDHNTAGYKMDFFKGMKYAQICPIFQARFDENMRFLFKSREEMEEEDQEIIKSINETPAQKAAKRRKLSEEAQEAKDLRKRLEVVDDVFIEATPFARKVPVVDYQIVLGIVKDRFSTSKPTNFSDEYMLLTLKTMFEKPDEQDAIWRNQKSVHGLALVKSWKLLTSCGVHVITLSTVQLFLLVERRYPLSRFTLEQLVNVTRLQVEEESEMSLELLRFTRQQPQDINKDDG